MRGGSSQRLTLSDILLHTMSASSLVGDSTLRPPLVGFQGIAAYATEAGLVALAAVLPALAHALGASPQLILIPIIIAAPIHRVAARGSK